MSFALVTDSSCNLTEAMIEEYNLKILPLTFMIEGVQYQSYLEGQHVDLSQFYTMMREGKTITTSLPNLVESEELFKEVLDAGQDLLYIGFSSGLSGTFNAIDLLLRNLAQAYPERKIFSVDSLAASGGQGLLVWYAAKQRESGKSIEEIRDWLENNKLNLAHWFTVDDLMFLFRGGRVSKTSAWAGTLLNIKPVLHVDDEGKLVPLEKVRGRRKSLNALIEHMNESALQPVSDQTIFITHGDCAEEAEYLANLIREHLGCTDVVINWIDPVIGAHAGPGTMALFFLADKR